MEVSHKKFSLEGDKYELLNQTNEPLRAVHFYNHNGVKKKKKADCNICAFCDVDEEKDALFCSKSEFFVPDKGGSCDLFNINRQALNDLYHGCI